MKKFNKSKVIIPALAMIALTTAASATGTVAWFTANRATTVETGSFVAFDDNRGLRITAANVIGTSVEGNVVTPLGSLTDGSYDFTKVWTDVARDDGEQPTAYVEAPASLLSGAKDASGNDVYYAVQWTYTIGLTNTTGTLAKSVDVMFDLSSAFANAVANSTAPGFRIAMKCGDEQLVFGNNSATGADKHVATASTTANFGDIYLTNNASYEKLADGVDHSTADEYLGTIAAANGTLTVNCTAWYEGTDPSVVSANAMSSVTATLKFYARNAA